MSPRLTLAHAHASSFPRVSGDEPDSDVLYMTTSEFSPRERG